MSDLGTIREVGLEPGYTGSISTKKAVKKERTDGSRCQRL